MTSRTKPWLKQYVTSLSICPSEVAIHEDFHEATKVNPATSSLEAAWVGAYMTEPRAILETAYNRKRFPFSEQIPLPPPLTVGAQLSSVLQRRTTATSFTGAPISLAELSTLLHASIGFTRIATIDIKRDLKLHFRPYASGGGLYPVEVYPLLLNVVGADRLVTHYDPVKHCLTALRRCDETADILGPLSDLDERLARAAVIIMMTAVFPRVTVKYGSRGYRFALIEAGEIAQNLSLCAAGMALGSLPWGGFFDDQVADLLKVNAIDEAGVHCLAIGQVP